MKKILTIGIPVLIGVVAVFLYINSVDSSDDNLNSYAENYKNNYRIYSPPIPEKIDFASEEVPLNIFYVSEMLEREILVNTYWHSNTLLLFKRAHRWFPVIEPILKKNNIPDDFKYLALIESGLTNITSPAGAKGFWQLMKATATNYGLEINSDVDERYHVEKSTEAACNYLRDSYKIYGNWTEAAASYNMGMGGLNNQMRKQNEDSYYNLSLNSETSRYVYRILALKALFEAPHKYGFYLRETDLFPALEYSEISLDSSITDMSSFAQTLGLSYKMLKELNPWLLTTTLNNKTKTIYTIKVPNSSMYDYRKLKDKLSNEIGVYGDRKK